MLERITAAPKTTIFFCTGPKPAKTTAVNRATVYFHTTSLHHIANKYQEIVSRLTFWDREFQQSLIHDHTLEELLDLAIPWIPHPIEIFDPSFHILASSKARNVQEEGFTFSASLGYTPPEYMSRIQQKNLLAQVQNSAAGIIKPSISGEISGIKTFNIYRCFKVHEKIAGYCTIFCGEKMPSQGYLDICELFFQNMEIYFTIARKQDKTSSYMYEYLLSSLMENYQSLTSRRLSDRLQYIKIPKTGIFTLIRFDFYKEESYSGYACNLLQKYFPTLQSFLHEEEVYMLVTMPEETPIHQAKEHIIEIIAQTGTYFGAKHSWQCYISNPFSVLSDIYYAKKQCQKLQKISSAELPNSPQSYFYEDYIIPHAFSYLEKEYDLNFLIWPLFWEIHTYDKKHHTCYIETLKQYLNNDCNLTRTAQAIHMHRNSVENRLKRIESLFHIDLSRFHTLHLLYWTFRLIAYMSQEES